MAAGLHRRERPHFGASMVALFLLAALLLAGTPLLAESCCAEMATAMPCHASNETRIVPPCCGGASASECCASIEPAALPSATLLAAPGGTSTPPASPAALLGDASLIPAPACTASPPRAGPRRAGLRLFLLLSILRN